jgi:hypothetical protein
MLFEQGFDLGTTGFLAKITQTERIIKLLLTTGAGVIKS